MSLGLALFFIGLLLSALFSGSETGFYRATRVRLLLDALGGDQISRTLHWLSVNPGLFVSTTLVGNNLANYVTSLGIVIAARQLPQSDARLFAELLAPVMLAPVVFVYGELLPKNLFYHVPNLLLRRVAPVFLIFTVLFSPVSAALWGLSRLLQFVLGEPPLRTRSTLARKELQEVLQEGQEAGILRPAQRNLAQGLFAVASRPIRDFCVPLGRAASVRLGDRKKEVIRLARRHGAAILPVSEKKGRELVGYVRIVDLALDEGDHLSKTRPLVRIRDNEPHIAVLIRMQTEREELALVTDENDELVGLVYADELTAPLFRGR